MSAVETLARNAIVFVAAGLFSVWWFEEVDSIWRGLWKSWPYIAGAAGIGYAVRRAFEGWGSRPDRAP